jgi:hypothetical protein
MKGEKNEEAEPQEPEAVDTWSCQVLESGGNGELARIIVRGKTEMELISRSLMILPIDNCLRQKVLMFVAWKWFDRFILGCIVLNSILLGIYQQRATKDEDHYWLNDFIDNQADHALWAIFTVESVLKIIAWGLICGKNTYLKDPWNILDFIVVMSGLIERLGLLPGLGVLRLFRLLRPLRSLNAVPQMKILVNTALSSILKLGNVMLLGAFLFMLFGIVGIQLMNGIFFRVCHTDKNPTMLFNGTEPLCWSWERTDDGRLCGGNYECDQTFTAGFCGGHEEDPDKTFRPDFTWTNSGGATVSGKSGYEWCAGSDPLQREFPETEFVNFDNLATAFLLIFQSMTLEGWTDLMYMVMDGFSPWWAQLYFFMIVVLTNFFMLNVALAVVDEVQDEFRDQAKEDEAAEAEALKDGEEEPPEPEEEAVDDSGPAAPWMDNGLVRFCNRIGDSQAFQNFIMLIILFNVVNMCLTWFSLVDCFGYVALNKTIEYLEITFRDLRDRDVHHADCPGTKGIHHQPHHRLRWLRRRHFDRRARAFQDVGRWWRRSQCSAYLPPVPRHEQAREQVEQAQGAAQGHGTHGHGPELLARPVHACPLHLHAHLDAVFRSPVPVLGGRRCGQSLPFGQEQHRE